MNKITRKIFILLLTVLLILPCFTQAHAGSTMSDTVDQYIDDIWKAQLKEHGVSTLQELVWSYADSAGSGEEWYVISLRQHYPDLLDFSEYRRAYEAYLEKTELKNATSRLKAALTLQAVGSTSGYINAAADDSIGEMGVMSYIYGLHILTNGAKCSRYTAEQTADALLSMQLADGGWAVMGDGGDVDVTAMAVQALAPYASKRADLKQAVEKAVQLLSERQREDGTFISFGEANAESTAQVLLALSCVGTDQKEDPRFTKNGRTVLDIIDSFRLGEGIYAHSKGGEANVSAQIQTLYSLTGYKMMLQGRGSLFVFGSYNEPRVERPAAVNLKPILYTGIAAAAVIACAVLFFLKKRSYKSYLFVVILAAVAVLGVRFINIEKPSDYYGKDDTVISDPVKTVLSIRCDTVAGEKSHIPTDGTILDRAEITINKGQTAYDQLISAAKSNSIHIDVSGGSYVAGIANIYELEFGDLSGWMFRVNGVFSDVNANERVLEDGDYVEWLYTKNIGKDIGNEYTGEK